MIENILDTKTKMKIAKLFAERDEVLQVSDVARILRISKSRASECLKELAEGGALERKIVGRSILYRLGSSSLAKAISSALMQEKILLSKIIETTVSEVRKLKPVSFVLFGSALKGLKIGSDVDFMFLYKGDSEKDKIYEISSKLTEKFGFHVSILAMSSKEFKTKARRGEEFVLNVMANHNLLYGKELDKVVW